MSELWHAVVMWDRATFLAIDHAWRCRALDAAMPIVTDLGLGHVQVLAILAAAVLDGAVAREVHLRGLAGSAWRAIVARRAWVVPLLVAFTISGLVSTSLKVMHRERPWWFYEQRHAAGIDRNVTVATVPGEYPLKVRGFPSGHTCSTASIAGAATIIFWRRRRGKLMAIGLWLATAMVGWSRMYLGSHWPLDVLGGLVIGAASGVIAVWLCRRRGCRTSDG